ncbi:hypothetical protein F3Y22_tig00110319pilonHSYRG00187 [Hibiscus syriacus]|uniref:Fe2OG dioxygenase domain-containing protein n=1 Tax=Hibiscus syriacus TaxID=106335 RepID=A0A6A3B4C7_HIBSY|nr:hypothetical protein F3Y22_tig00110319pilonHSYRG00187 [Hibiscus syriacus]
MAASSKLLLTGLASTLKQIALACQQDGFFQVKNHGISEATINNMLRLAIEFFNLPESERLKNYSDDPSVKNRLSTSFNVKTEKVANWRDFSDSIATLSKITSTNGLQIPHPSDDVPGLQVLRNGKWVAVHPIPYTFIVNIGDQMQVISNDRYKSVLHRAVVNRNKERISIPTFYCPSPDALIGPATVDRR